MAVTLQDSAGALGRPGSVVTLDRDPARFGVVARSADAALEDRATDAIARRWPDDWPTDIPDAVLAAADFLSRRFGLIVAADTTPGPSRPTAVARPVIH